MSNLKRGENMYYMNIEVERIRKGITKTELANKLGITPKTYQNWQKSGNIPSSKLISLSSIFDCSVDFLLKNTKPNNQQSNRRR